MPKLDHLSVIAPTLEEGVSHVKECLDVDIPFGRKHTNMGTHNCLLQLGGLVYLEVIAIDENAVPPTYPRWFGLDERTVVKKAWDQGRRLRAWVASTNHFELHMTNHASKYGEMREFQSKKGSFFFAVPRDGSPPFGGVAPSLIDRCGKIPSFPTEANMGCQLEAFRVLHSDVRVVTQLYQTLKVTGSPKVEHSESLQFMAEIQTPSGTKTLF